MTTGALRCAARPMCHLLSLRLHASCPTLPDPSLPCPLPLPPRSFGSYGSYGSLGSLSALDKSNHRSTHAGHLLHPIKQVV